MFGRATIRLGIGPHSSLTLIRSHDRKVAINYYYYYNVTIGACSKPPSKIDISNSKNSLTRGRSDRLSKIFPHIAMN